MVGDYLDEGAIAEVFALPGGTEVVKEFRRVTAEERARVNNIAHKVQAMLDRPPAMQIHRQGASTFVQIAWPQRAVVDERGGIVGFTMPRISSDAVSLTGIFSQRNRDKRGLRSDLTFRTYVAVNLCQVIGYVASAGHLVMDFNPKNFVVDRTNGWVGLLDCDGFAVWDGSTFIPADAAKTEEVAPEFRDPNLPMNYDVNEFDERQMRFGLAVTLFKLFNEGNSPAAGKHLNASEPSGDNARIAQRLFSIDPARAGLEPPGDITGLMEDETLDLFRQAFLGADDDRPSAPRWAAHWHDMTKRIRPCPADPHVFHFSKPCAKCGVVSAPIQMGAPPYPGPSGGGAAPAPRAPRPAFQPSARSASSRQVSMERWRKPTLIGGAVLLSFLAVRAFTSRSASPPPDAPPSSATSPSPAPALTVSKPWAIAAIAANLRGSPTGEGRLGVLARGALLQQLDESETHVKVMTESGAVGWVSRDVIMASADLPRLANLSAQDYIASRSDEHRMDQLRTQLAASNDELRELYRVMPGRGPDVATALDRLDASRKVSIAADTSAAKWFAFEAAKADGEGRFDASRQAYVAAIEADPANPVYHTGLAFVDYKTGDVEALKASMSPLPVLAPKATNTWFLAGLAWGGEPNLEAFTSEAFHLAYTFSTDPRTTKGFLVARAGDAKDDRIRQALLAALQEINGTAAPSATPAPPAPAPPAPAPSPAPAPVPAPQVAPPPASPVAESFIALQAPKGAPFDGRPIGLMLNASRDSQWAMLDRQVESIRAGVTARKGDRQAARTWMDQGKQLSAAGRYDEAVDAYRHASEADPSDPEPLVKAAQWLAYVGNHQQAVSTYTQGLLLAPDLAYGWAMLAQELAVTQDRPGDAQYALRIALHYERQRPELLGWMQRSLRTSPSPVFREALRRTVAESNRIPQAQ